MLVLEVSHTTLFYKTFLQLSTHGHPGREGLRHGYRLDATRNTGNLLIVDDAKGNPASAEGSWNLMLVCKTIYGVAH